MDKGHKSTFAVPRRLLSPSYNRDVERYLSSTASEANGCSALSSPKRLIGKYGFRVATVAKDMATCSKNGDHDGMAFHEPDQLRTLAIMAVDDGINDDDQCVFVNRDYLAVWNPTVGVNLLSIEKQQLEEVAFPGSKHQLHALLRCIWPSGAENWPLSIEQLKEAIGPCCDWGMHPSLVSTISYYLHNNFNIPASDKLKLAAQCGNMLLLAGTLQAQCKRDTIFDIVNRSPTDYQLILDGPFAAFVTGKMLEHAAREGDEEYKEFLAELVRLEQAKFKDRCRELLDFTSIDGQESASQCCLVISGSDQPAQTQYYINKAYISSWSPVFQSMFYGDFADSRNQRITMELSDPGEHRYWRLFLTLIHPSYMCTLWRLLPQEYCMPNIGRMNNDRPNWIDDTFQIIFDEAAFDALMHVFKLAHKFQVMPLLDFCVLMIEAKSELSLADKILMADTYHLPKLMEWCVAKLTTSRSVKRMFSENKDLLVNLTCSSHKILLERMLELV